MKINDITFHSQTLPNTQKSVPTFGAKVTFSDDVKDIFLAYISAYEPGFWAKKFKKAQNPIEILMTKIEKIYPEQEIKIYDTKGWTAFNYITGNGFVTTKGKFVAENLTTGKKHTAEKDSFKVFLEEIISYKNFWEKGM